MINQTLWTHSDRLAALHRINDRTARFLPCYRLKPLILRLMGNRGETGASAVAPGPLEVNWWLRKHTEEEKPLGRSSGPGQIPRGVNMEALRASLFLVWEGTSCFSSVTQKDGQWPTGLPSSPHLAAKQRRQKCWAEGNTRWCQSCSEWKSLAPTPCSCFPTVPPPLSQLTDWFSITSSPEHLPLVYYSAFWANT